MKAKLIKGKGFRGALAYVLGKQNRCVMVGGNMAGQTPRQLAAEFALSRQLAPDATNPVVHMPLAVPPGEHLTDETWQEAAHIVMRAMGLDPENHQHVIVRHTDREHEHVHVVASRIGLDGRKWNVSHDVRKMINGTQQAERALGLTQTKGLDSRPVKRTRPEAPGVARLQAAIDVATANRPAFRAFVERLEAGGVRVRPAMSRDGTRLNGLSFESGGIAFKGSALGSAYGFGKLSQRMDFNLDRDRALLVSLRDGTTRPVSVAPAARAENPPATAGTPAFAPSAPAARLRPAPIVSGHPAAGAHVQTRGRKNDTMLANLTEAEEIEARALVRQARERVREASRAQAQSAAALNAWIGAGSLPDYMRGTLSPQQPTPPQRQPDSKPPRQEDHNLSRFMPGDLPRQNDEVVHPPQPPEPTAASQPLRRRRFGPG